MGKEIKIAMVLILALVATLYSSYIYAYKILPYTQIIKEKGWQRLVEIWYILALVYGIPLITAITVIKLSE